MKKNFTLIQADLNKEYEIKEINSEYGLKYIRRLYELGFISGEKVTILRRSFLNKTLLIKIKGYALLLGAEIASQIILKEAI
ncbi:MAG: FeoA family protein [Clostridia bacterium]|nr:FeoA family protein [Clostridia bacterium]